MLKFEITHQSTLSKARTGILHTPHGSFETPGFVPVGTNATIKTLTPDQMEALNIPLMFCNTYHLLLHPGPEVIANVVVCIIT